MHGLGIGGNLWDLVGKSLCQMQIKERNRNLRLVLCIMNQILFSVLLEICISKDGNAGLISPWFLDYLL